MGPHLSCQSLLAIPFFERLQALCLGLSEREQAHTNPPTQEQALARLHGGRTACERPIESYNALQWPQARSSRSSQATLPCAARRAAPGAAGRSGQRSTRQQRAAVSGPSACAQVGASPALRRCRPAALLSLSNVLACSMLLSQPLWCIYLHILLAAALP